MVHLITLLTALNLGATYDAEYVKNYDADTWTVYIQVPLVATVLSPEWVTDVQIEVQAEARILEQIRLDMIDTPEIRGKCPEEKKLAKEAKFAVEDILVNAEKITLTFDEREKFGRILTDISVDGVSMPEWLVEENYAVYYDGGKRQSWCE